MLKWLRAALRKWLLEDEEVSLAIDAWIDGKLVRVEAVSAIGLMLQVRTHNGIMLIGEHQAADRKAFWRVWKRHTGKYKLTWEDGTPFKPGW